MSILADTLARLKAYQLRMIERLKTVGVLSAPKAIFVDVSNEPDTLIARQLEKLRENRAEDRPASPGPDALGCDSKEAEPPIAEAEILNDLTSNPAKPGYLLLARAGTGKSVLLESFARAMNAKLGRSLKRGKVSAVPLLVRLRDFNAEAAAPGIKTMLESAELRIFGINGDDPPILQPNDLACLAREGLLVPMFDGYDEFVHRAPFVTALKNARSNPDLLQKCSLAVTSRQDVDYRTLPIDPKFRREIQPLTETQVKAYVVSQRGIKVTHLEKAPPSILRLLTQPLYLCIWCNCIARRSTAPQTLDELMLALFADYLERRGRLPTEAECAGGKYTIRQRNDRLLALRRLYARVCNQVARVGFGREVSIGELAVLSDAEIDEITSLKERIGVIELLPHDQKLYVNQIPAVEYLVGWEMAQAFVAGADPKRRCDALEQFASWVWQPEMHEVLDYFFDVLWSSKDSEQIKAAGAFIKWLMDVSNGDLVSKGSWKKSDRIPWDDLVRPFCISGLRWVNLKGGLAAGDSQLREVCRAVTVLVRRDRFSGLQSVGGALRERLLAALTRRDSFSGTQQLEENVSLLGSSAISALLGEYLAAARQAENANILNLLDRAIGGTMKWIGENQAIACLCELLDAAKSKENASIRRLLGHAISGTAERVGENRVMACVRELLNAARLGENADIRDLLGQAIQNAARQVGENQALACVRELLCAAALKENADIRDRLGLAIAGAARWIGENQAPECVREILDAARLGENADIRDLLGHAIQEAASQVGENQALAFVREWLRAARLKENADIRHLLGLAIAGAARRTGENQALANVREMLDAAKLKKNADIRDLFRPAIYLAASRIGKSQALACVREWLCAARLKENADIRQLLGSAIVGAMDSRQPAHALACARELLNAASLIENADIRDLLAHGFVKASWRGCKNQELAWVRELLYAARLKQNAEIRDFLRLAIVGAARRIGENEALASVREWLNAADLIENTDILDLLGRAIKGVAGRIGENQALVCARELLNAARLKGNAGIRGLLGEAITGIAGRIGENQALVCARELLNAAKLEENADIRYLLRQAIREVAGRIPAGQQVEAAGWALELGELDLAFRIASNGTVATIVSQWGKLPPPAQVMGVAFKAIARTEMKLALDSAAVPEVLRGWIRAARPKAEQQAEGKILQNVVKNADLPLTKLPLSEAQLTAIMLLYDKLSKTEQAVLRLHMYVGGFATPPGSALCDKNILECWQNKSEEETVARELEEWKLADQSFTIASFRKARQRVCDSVRKRTFNDLDVVRLIEGLQIIRFWIY